VRRYTSGADDERLEVITDRLAWGFRTSTRLTFNLLLLLLLLLHAYVLAFTPNVKHAPISVRVLVHDDPAGRRS
jgi:hypothetical protein